MKTGLSFDINLGKCQVGSADLIGGSKGSEKISILKSGLEVEKDTKIKIARIQLYKNIYHVKY